MMETPQTTGFPHDEEYYLRTVVFLVEGYLFSVPRYYFASCSDIFASIFELPPGDIKSQEGSSDEKPFVLEGISRDDFRGLLRVMYPLRAPHLGGDLSLSKNDWVSALKLSTMWNFRNIRQLAIAKLSSIDTDHIEKIILAKQYKVPQWLLDGYHELVRRPITITTDEAARLGLETTVYLFHIREELSSSEYNYGYRRREEQNFTDIVRRVFKQELRDVEEANIAYNSLPAVYDA